MNDQTVHGLNLHINPCDSVISMMSSNLTGRVIGRCEIDIIIQSEAHPKVKLGIFKGLCTDFLMGEDFQRQHKRVIF